MKTATKIILAVCLFLYSITVWSASTKQEIIELQEAVASLKEGQESMQKDLAEIKKLVQSGARAAPAKAAFREQEVSIGGSPYLGDTDATLTLIEFSDYQCPFCSRHYRDVMPQIVADYVDTGKVKYVMLENPLSSIHKNAYNASLAALCAGDEGKYWEMHNIMFDNQKQLDVKNLETFAADIGLNTSEFDTCLDGKKYERQVNSNLAMATKLGIQSTPGFVIGLTDQKDTNKVNLSVYIKGAQAFDKFKANIDELLDSAN